MRRGALIYIIFVLSLLTTVATLGTLVALNTFSNNLNRQTTAQLVAFSLDKNVSLQKLKASTEAKIADLDDKIKQQQDQLTKVSNDLTAKKKTLDGINAKIKVQQAQLATDSAELNKLKNRPPDQPPLFN